MKKLILAAIIGCTAMFANAAAVSWYVGYVTDADGVNLLGPSDTDYIAVFSIYSDSSLSTLVTSGSINSWDDGLAMDDTYSLEVDNSVDTLYYGKVIITHGASSLESDGFQFEVTTVADIYDLAVMTTPDETSVYKIGGDAFDGTNGAFETAGGGGGWAPVIPEPTTGLLVLLGVAGLALRRRRA